jgi:hypothetical protein
MEAKLCGIISQKIELLNINFAFWILTSVSNAKKVLK